MKNNTNTIKAIKLVETVRSFEAPEESSDIRVIEDVEVFDPHYNNTLESDLYVVKDLDGFDIVICVDRNNMLFELTVKDGKLTMLNSNGFGTINYVDKTVEGWDFDREPKTTVPVGFTSTGRYLEDRTV